MAAADASKAVDSLYEFRNHYFETNDLSCAPQREQDVATKIAEAVAVLEPLLAADPRNAQLLYEKGRALNAANAYSKEAEEALSRAVKFDPNFTDAWNLLGECFWKKGDAAGSKNCFEGALAQRKSKESMRSLSIVLRQVPGDAAARTAALTESIARAKEAVAMDPTDGESWAVLGNAHLALCFAGTVHAEGLRAALKAYQQAERDPHQARNNPDLHYNRAQVHKYLANYQSAIEGFAMASKLEPANPLPKQQLSRVVEHCQRTAVAIAGKGRLKTKRIQAIMTTLASTANAVVALLQDGPNPSAKLRAIVIAVLTLDDVPQVYLAMDTSGVCFALMVYNMAPDAIKVDDDVVVPDPLLQRIALACPPGSLPADAAVPALPAAADGSITLAYPAIRVDQPATLLINGKPLGTAKVAPSALMVSASAS